MEIQSRSLECFVVLAAVLNFRRAAHNLRWSQPALSMRIKLLEQYVVTPLYSRYPRQVALTPGSEAFQTCSSSDRLHRTCSAWRTRVHFGQACRVPLGRPSILQRHRAPRSIPSGLAHEPRRSQRVLDHLSHASSGRPKLREGGGRFVADTLRRGFGFQFFAIGGQRKFGSRLGQLPEPGNVTCR